MNMHLYGSTARFDTGRPLTEEELKASARSIFAVEKHASRSERFAPIPTIDVVRGLQKEGFFPVAAKQCTVREASRADFTKHLIRFRRFDNVEAYSVGDTVCEIILKNANDGTSAYDLMAGLFRIRCLNSLVAQIGTIDTVKVRHSGDAIGKVIEGTYRVLETSKLALAAPQDWSGVQLSDEERNVFATAAHGLRFDAAEDNREHAIAPVQLLNTRRGGDQGSDLWTTFNVVQENSIRGGLRGVGYDANGRRRRVTTRAVNGIDQDVKLNRALWILAEGMAKLKGVSPIAQAA